MMLKHILGKLPPKSSKSSNDDGGVNPHSTAKLSHGTNSRNSSKSIAGAGEPLNSGSAARTDDSNIGSAGMNYVSRWKKLAGHAMAPGSYEALSNFRDVPSSEMQNLLIRKLDMCRVVFDFCDPINDRKEKEMKRQTLLEVVDYISSVSTKFSEIVMLAITKMVAANLFREFPSANHDNKGSETYDSDDAEFTMEPAEFTMDPAWPHLQIVYEVLLRFVCSPQTDAKLAKRYIDHLFLLRLLELFDSVDPREREYLKVILHRIYGKFMVHRPYIRRIINNIFYTFIFETEKHNGIAELLEVLGSIINGFALPLKNEYYLFLVHVLIPLHKPKCISMYHQQLSYCIIQFMEKDWNLAYTVIRGLLKYWTITNSLKEVLFLGELEEVLEATQPAEFQRCMVPLFRRIGRCLNSSNAKVSERALFLWNNDHIMNLIIPNRNMILPIILPALEKNMRDHWSVIVQSLTRTARKIFEDADQELFDECLSRFQEDEAKEEDTRMRRELAWKRLEDTVTCGVVCNEAVPD